MFGRARKAVDAVLGLREEAPEDDPLRLQPIPVRGATQTEGAAPGNDQAPPAPGPETPTWEQLVRDHSDMVYRVAFRLTGNQHDAEDLTQDVFVRAFKSIHAFEPGTLTGWLHRITTNLFIDQTRRRQKIRIDPMAEAQERVTATGEAPDHDLDHDITRALAELTPEHRVAVVLCDIEGLSYDEIASILDVSVTTVRSRIHRGREKLRTSLAHRRPTAGNTRVQGAPDEQPGQARELDDVLDLGPIDRSALEFVPHDRVGQDRTATGRTVQSRDRSRGPA
ncbi:sigma-70 family RNA polymerase sigma factor [Aestuariimicrobium kwangyangense]|uniref:sigma-70 family RNA polymerase sigma factor n=1 Tax=Aestuariimicrobium kwangyangense TaxID=396389 RepID=UPI0003B68B26|nr:sigma-70 family RNA polymerase sigma factor [Aestuariimicrobium kwangyangense]